MIGLVAMDDAGFVIGSYVVTFAVIGLLAWRYVMRGRALAAQVDDDDKDWL